MATAHVFKRPVHTATVFAIVVLALVFVPNVAGVQATGMLGGLRSAGQPAFVIAHRGDSAVTPENTIAAVRSALAGPAEFVEVDLRLTSDRVAVLMHDSTVDRTTTGTGKVRQLTLAEVRELDAGIRFDRRFVGEAIPTFEEFLGVMAESDKKAMVELKGHWKRADVRRLANLVADSSVRHRLVFASSNPSTLENLGLDAGQFPRMVITRELPADPVELAYSYGAIALVVSHAAIAADPWAVALLNEVGIGVIVYTLNLPAECSVALALGVDGVVTDRPLEVDNWLGIGTVVP